MIFDPDGEHAICDDGRMAVPVYSRALNAAGFPTGERRRIGFAEPGQFLAGTAFRDED